MITGKDFFKFRQNGWLKNQNLSEKNPPRAQTFRYFRYKSRNNDARKHGIANKLTIVIIFVFHILHRNITH